MRLLPIMLILALIIIPLSASAHGAVILVIDGFGSSYLSPGSATYVEGSPIVPVSLDFVSRANAAYELRVPVPSTEYGHAAIATGYSNATQEMVSYFHATIFDALRDDGYIVLGMLENGDTKEMLGEMDVAVREKNGSVYSPCFEYVLNGNGVPSDLSEFMMEYPKLPSGKAGKGSYSAYIVYNGWGLGFVKALVGYMNYSYPGEEYIIMANIGGLDSAGQNAGFEGYRAVLAGIDSDMGALIDACEASGTILAVTGDHGMSFKKDTARGSHSAPEVSSRKESLMVPFLIYSAKAAGGNGTYGQECFAPTLLALLDEPNTMSLSDGEPLPVKEKPALYLDSKEPLEVTVTGPGFNRTIQVSGIYRITGMEKGDYTVCYGDVCRMLRLDHDELLILEEGKRPSLLPWMVYMAVAAISVAGTGIALWLAWARR